MATGYKREKTKYPGVFLVERDSRKFLYILYRKPGSRKLIEEKLGSSKNGWTPAKASLERSRRIEGKASNVEKREKEKARKKQEYFRPMFSDAKLRAKKLKQATGLVLANAVQGGEESFSDDELEEDEILDYNILDW